MITINLDHAISLDIPRHLEPLTPYNFKMPNDRDGWVISLPGSRPIATPAYDDGMLFVGGGYGSHKFYAFDAKSGKIIWKIRTTDDGPTAAVVEDGCVAFNTESCTIIVCEAKTGRVLWQEWLGDPLMSQPAIYKGRLFMVYPSGQRSLMLTRAHRLLCAELRTGHHLWEQDITADVMTAPVINSDKVFIACFDGTSFCFRVDDGKVIWRKKTQATSAPLIVKDNVIVTERGKYGQQIGEGIKRRHRYTAAEFEQGHLAYKQAVYLGKGHGGGSGLKGKYSDQLDEGVGFSSKPSAAKLEESDAHVGVSSVAGAWAYQGSRVAYKNGKIFNAQGVFVHCIDDESGKTVWEAKVTGRMVNPDDQIFLPPVVGKDYLYLCSTLGHIVSLRQDNGEVGLMYATGHSMSFQPCLARGSIYAGTLDGKLIRFDTGSLDADDWYMWGGNAQHNKIH